MLKIGIVGAENSHCAGITVLLNIRKRLGAKVAAVWGERPKFAKAAAKAGNIPMIVKDWRDMLGHVDGVMIDHRHPKYHAEVAAFFVKNGIPCFVDKPFTYTLAEGKRLCALARKKKVPITSFSVIPLQKNFRQFQQAVAKLGSVANVNTSGPVDLKSKYGGIFFYGIHQVDAVLEAFGTNVDAVCVHRNGEGGVAVLTYKNGPTVTMNLANNGNRTFHWSVVGEKDILNWPHAFDENLFLAGAKTFVKMFKTGKEPYSHERLLAPVAVLEALDKSIKRGGRIRVATVARK